MTKSKLQYWFLVFGFWFLVFIPYLYCADIPAKGVVQPEYNAAGKRDPFSPLVTKDGRAVYSYGTTGSVEDIKLEGIVYDPGGDSIAVINGMILKENDSVGDIKLIKIESNRVHLIFDEKRHIINLEE